MKSLLFWLWWCWVLFKTCFQELTKWLIQALRQLWATPFVRNSRQFLTLTFRIIAATLIFWKIKRLLSGQIDWIPFLDSLTDEFIKSLIVH